MWCFMIVVWSGLVELVTWLSTVSRIYRYARIKYKNWIRFAKIELTGAFVVCLTWSWTLWLSFALTSWFTLTWFCHSVCQTATVTIVMSVRTWSTIMIVILHCQIAAQRRKFLGLILSHDAENVQNTTAEIHVPEKLATPQLVYHFDPATGVPSTFSDPGGRELE